MKFACPSCKTRYSIADEKLPVGASVKFKCKNCGTTIRLKRKQETAAKPQKLEDLENSAASTRVAPLGQLQELREQAAAKAAAADLNQPLSSRAEATAVVSLAQLNELRNQAASPEPIAPADEWYVLVSGNQNGPMPVSELGAMVERREVDRRNFVWKAGMDDWKRLADVPELSDLLTPNASTPVESEFGGESTAMMDASALHDALAKSRDEASRLFEEQTEMMSASELQAQLAGANPTPEPDQTQTVTPAAVGMVSGDTFTDSTAMMDVTTLREQLAKASDSEPSAEPTLTPTQSPFETGPLEALGGADAQTPVSGPSDSAFGDVTSAGFDATDAGFQVDTQEAPGPEPGSFHKAQTQVARLDDIAAMTGIGEETAAELAPTDSGMSLKGADPFASLGGPDEELEPFDVSKFDTEGLQGSYDHDAPPGEQTRVFMATAGIYKRRRRNLISAIVGTAVVGALATVIALDFMGVYTIPGMGLAYELTGFEDPNKERVLEREISRETDPEKVAELRRALLGLNPDAPKGDVKKRPKKNPEEGAVEEGIVETGELDESQKEIAKSLFQDERKTDGKLALQQPGKVTAQVDLPEGLDAETIQKVIAEKQSAMKLCLAEASRSNESLRGRMEVQLTIAPTGKVTEALITSAKFKQSTMGACTVKRVQSWKFPRFNGTPVTVAFPYVLTEGF